MRSIILSLFFIAVQAHAFTVKSSSFKAGAALPMKYVFNSFGCSGENITPSLEWSKAPAGTKSFAITVFDPDAPTGSGWWHWTLFNIPAGVTSLKEGEPLPLGAVEGLTDFGKPGYGGPCPPPGKPHHYIFTVYAIKEAVLPLDKSSSGAMVGYNLNANKLAKASITVMFGRDK